MPNVDVVQLTRDLVAIGSASQFSNSAVSELIETTLKQCGFDVERLEYLDENGERKVSLVGQKGEGAGGLALLSHSDTVPGTGWESDPLNPRVEGNRLIGLGSCDMKGPLAATIAAAERAKNLKKPVFVVVTADEEIGLLGARHVVNESAFFKNAPPLHGVVAEPTRLLPIHQHKGGARVVATARGVAAHTSTDKGISANFLIAPFIAEMAELAAEIKSDERYMNREFEPPTNGFNMVFDDGGCAMNVTAAKTTCMVGFRPMPGDRSEELIERVADIARKHDLEVTSSMMPPFHTAPDAPIVQTALEATGEAKPGSVSFGTDAIEFMKCMELVILGPGDIAQAHTAGEWIDIDQLHDAVDVYSRMIDRLCCS